MKDLDSMDSEQKTDAENFLTELIAFWKYCLLKCSYTWITNNAKLCFPIVCTHDKNSTKWIVKMLLVKSQQSCLLGFFKKIW